MAGDAPSTPRPRRPVPYGQRIEAIRVLTVPKAHPKGGPVAARGDARHPGEHKGLRLSRSRTELRALLFSGQGPASCAFLKGSWQPVLRSSGRDMPGSPQFQTKKGGQMGPRWLRCKPKSSCHSEWAVAPVLRPRRTMCSGPLVSIHIKNSLKETSARPSNRWPEQHTTTFYAQRGPLMRPERHFQ